MNTQLKSIDLSDVDIYAGDVNNLRYRAAVMLAASLGAIVQSTHRGQNTWSALCVCPSWNWSDFNYRIDPASKPRRMVPWDRPEDVPFPVCGLRTVGQKDRRILTAIFDDRILVDGYALQWSELDAWEHTTDGKTWLPCEKEAAL